MALKAMTEKLNRTFELSKRKCKCKKKKEKRSRLYIAIPFIVIKGVKSQAALLSEPTGSGCDKLTSRGGIHKNRGRTYFTSLPILFTGLPSVCVKESP